MKKLVQLLIVGAALAAFASVSMAQSAQDTTPSTSTSPQAQQPAAAPATTDQAPASTSSQPATSGDQTTTSPSQSPSGSQMDQQQTPPSQAQQPTQPQSQTPPDTTPDATGKTGNSGMPSATGSQSFTGTVVKQGDKYVFQDSATGNTYDIDHQDEVAKYDGKKVKVHGVLDAGTHTIHLQ